MEGPSNSEGRIHPAPSAKWVDIQQKTFTNWVNEQLRPTGEQVRTHLKFKQKNEISLCFSAIE